MSLFYPVLRMRHYSNDQPKQDSEIQLQPKPRVPKKNGALSPSDIPDVQNPVGIRPDEIKESLNELNEIIQSTCHP